jgi:hypothetical protein
VYFDLRTLPGGPTPNPPRRLKPLAVSLNYLDRGAKDLLARFLQGETIWAVVGNWLAIPGRLWRWGSYQSELEKMGARLIDKAERLGKVVEMW